MENTDKTIVLSDSKPAATGRLSLNDMRSFADLFIKSQLFPDTKNLAQAIVKIQAGQELGLAPFEAMRSLNIIQGQVALSAGAISARIKGSGKYDFEILALNDKEAELQFYINGQPVKGTSKFTIEDAQKAGLTSREGWRKYPRNYLFARALTNGARWICPDVFNGAIYTPEELRSNDLEVADLEGEIEAPSAVSVDYDLDAIAAGLKTSSEVRAFLKVHKNDLNREQIAFLIEKGSDLKDKELAAANTHFESNGYQTEVLNEVG